MDLFYVSYIQEEPYQQRTTCVEESELLNGNGSRQNIKEERKAAERDLIEYLKAPTYDSFHMQDAPFEGSRSGSEEDMLEYDDEPLVNCDGCRRRRPCTVFEKSLAVFGFVCVIIIIILAVKVSHKTETVLPKQCSSPECLSAASSIVSAMDPRADPCEDFHQYACGNWLRDTPIPPGFSVWDRFQELSYKNLYTLRNLIENHQLVGSGQQAVRSFYVSCMQEGRGRRETTLDDFRVLLSNVSRDDEEFNFPSALIEAHKLTAWSLFQLTVGPDERDPVRNIIKIEAGESPFPHGLFKSDPHVIHQRDANRTGVTPPSTPVHSSSTQSPTTTTAGSTHAPSSSEHDANMNATDNSTESQGTNNSQTTTATISSPPPTTTRSPPSIKDTHPHPTHNVSELVRSYLTETSALIQSLWKRTKDEADREAERILELERRLSLAHDIDIHVHERTMAYNGRKITDLQNQCSIFDWSKYLNGILGSASRPIGRQDDVIVLHEPSLLRVCEIVVEYTSNSTLTSTLRKYILLGVARTLSRYFDRSTFQPDINADDEAQLDGEHWRRCAFYTNRALGLATGSIYVNASTSHTSLANEASLVEQVKTIVDYVKRAFKDYLLRKMWMDDRTRSMAAAKIDAMIEKVNYPSYILNTSFIDEHYKQFTVGKNWLRNLLNWRAFVISGMSRSLTTSYDRVHSWINPPVTVEADYSAVRNDIIFPIALFHLPIYGQDAPTAMNFGALGSIVGHEITHAFDIQGRQYDGFGRLRDWWDPVTAEKFNITTQCMRDQYDHFIVGNTNMTINGEQTLEENIADNGGIRAAYMAYELWLNERGDEMPLPGVNLNNRQIFYVSFAQLYCSKWKESGIQEYLARDSHSPGPFRIQGALSNSLAFRQVFQCSKFTKYNPDVTCQVW